LPHLSPAHPSPRFLLIEQQRGCAPVHGYFSTIEELAVAFGRRFAAQPHGCPFSASRVQDLHQDWDGLSFSRLSAFNRGGAQLAAQLLLDLADSLHERERAARWARVFKHYHPGAPVPGVSKSRGGNGYFRRVGTFSEAKQNALTVREDGEPAARPSRTYAGLPHAWDDVHRARPPSWKRQHKGRKAWDRG
jgi:hypothetical protein